MSNPNEPGAWSSTPQPQPPGGYSGGRPSGPSGPRASFGARLVAAIIDGVVVGIVGLVLWRLLGVFGYFLWLVLGIVYQGYFEGGPAGQTVGKLAMGIRVIRFDNGGPLGWGTSLLRAVIRGIVSPVLCGLGFWWMLWDPEKQTWHDKIAGTVVVPAEAYPPPPNSFGQPPQ